MFFSNLKKLELCCGKFSNEDFANRIFSSCPVLEDLILENCDWNDVQNISLTSSILRSFKMIDSEDAFGNNLIGGVFEMPCA